MRNWANYQQLRRQSPPTKEDGTQTIDIELLRTRGARQASSKQSLPGPDSGGRSTSSLTATHSAHAPADVRVRGTEGQQPLEAFRLHPQKSDIKANLFVGIPKGSSRKNQPLPRTDSVDHAKTVSHECLTKVDKDVVSPQWY